MTDDPVRFVAAAFRGHGRARSKLYWWMAEHYDALSKAKEQGKRVDWISVTAELTALGIKGPGGTQLKPETVRRTWHRIAADMKTHSGSVQTPAPVAKQTTPPPPAASSPRSSPRADDTDDEPPPILRRPITRPK